MYHKNEAKMKKVLLSLGSNLGDRLQHIHNAYQLIEERIGKIKKRSSIYVTPAWGFQSENDFFNSVICVDTVLSAQMVLIESKAIENLLGRKAKKTESYEDRLIDIDLVDFDGEIISTEELIIPHPKMHERSFVLVPLSEIYPTWVHPILKVSAKIIEDKMQDVSKIVQLNEK